MLPFFRALFFVQPLAERQLGSPAVTSTLALALVLAQPDQYHGIEMLTLPETNLVILSFVNISF